MNVDRHEYQGGLDVALERIRFCLDQLEKASDFEDGIDWETNVVPRLTIEEFIGALVSAGQALEDLFSDAGDRVTNTTKAESVEASPEEDTR